MTPGGDDLVLDGPTSDDDWIVIFHRAKRAWPDAVFHRVEHGDAAIYRDEEAFRERPPGQEGPRGIIRVLMAPDRLTVVVDAEDEESSRVGRALYEAVRASRA